MIERQRRGNHFLRRCFHFDAGSPEGNDISTVERMAAFETKNVQLGDLERLVL